MWLACWAVFACLAAYAVALPAVALPAVTLPIDAAASCQQLPPSPSPLRVAVLGFADSRDRTDKGNDAVAGELARAFAKALAGDERVQLLDAAMTMPALAGVGYRVGAPASLNLHIEEARRLGAAIGCDFFIIGKADCVTRSEQAGEAHEESFAGVLLVDGRNGNLAHFDFLLQRAATCKAAEAATAEQLAERASGYVDAMLAFRSRRETATITDDKADDRADEAAEALPAADSPLAAGFKPPEFTSRVKPQFTDSAHRADITATVEARVVFRASGEIGSIDILRWAGFGLEASSIAAIRQLRFKPATRNGKPVTVRAVVQYNFRRLDR